MFKRSSVDVSFGPVAPLGSVVLLVAAWAVLAAVVLASLTQLDLQPPPRPRAVAERGPRPGDRW